MGPSLNADRQIASDREYRLKLAARLETSSRAICVSSVSVRVLYVCPQSQRGVLHDMTHKQTQTQMHAHCS
jgi:hypothetical protein